MRFFEGQQLWFVYADSRRRLPGHVRVKTAGRKWATLDNHQRVCVRTLAADGGKYSSPGRAYLAKEDWLAEQSLSREWSAFARAVSRQWSPPAGLTPNAIRDAAQMLHVEYSVLRDA